MKLRVLVLVAFTGCLLCVSVKADVVLTFTDSFQLQNTSAGGIAVDDSTVYVTHVSRPEMDLYSHSGTYLATTALTGVSTQLGGYTGATVRNGTELYLTAMHASRDGAVYRFLKSGEFQERQIFSPVIDNPTAIGFDGNSVYANQNDSPQFAYRVDPSNGSIQQAFSTNPGRGQRLGLDFWDSGNVLIESYDSGVSILSAADGTEQKFFSFAELGYSAQTFGVDVRGDELFLMTRSNVYKYTLSAIPEPSSTIMLVSLLPGLMLRRQRKLIIQNRRDITI